MEDAGTMTHHHEHADHHHVDCHHADHADHHHADHHPHGSLRLVPVVERRRLARPVHRIGRRRFLAELGRNTVAVAILGGIAIACSDETGDAEIPQPPDSPPDASGTAPDDSLPGEGQPTATSEVRVDQQLRWSQVDLGFVSAFVLVRGNEAAVVDTGTSGSADQIGETLATLGVTFDDVRHVVLTHHHPDHVGSLADVIGRAASAAAYAGAADIVNITSPVDVTAVGDGDDVFGLQVIDTPGHTPGSISVLDTGIGLLIAGDALNGNDDGTAITGPNARFTADMETAGASVVKLAGFDFDLAGFGHGQPVRAGAGTLVDALVAS